MNCQQCGTALPEGAMFCPECGTKVTQTSRVQPKMVYCPKCGTKADEDSAFCEMCGYPLKETKNAYIPEPEPEKEKKSGALKALIIAICVLSVLLVAGLGALGVKVFILDKNKDNSLALENMEAQSAETAETEADTAEAQGETGVESGTSANANIEVVESPSEAEAGSAAYNLFQNRQATLDGTMADRDGARGIYLANPTSVYGAGSSGKAVLLKNVDFVKFNTKNARVTQQDIDAVNPGMEIGVSGNLSIIQNELVIFPDSMGDPGQVTETVYAAPTKAATPKPTKAPTPTPVSAYILEKSATDYLTDADVRNLTLQELNYAKNEIYARHGRKFKSPELQRYFGSKSWYSGTVDPDRFSESVFSKVELANIKFLAGKEFAINPNGYPLDKK